MAAFEVLYPASPHMRAVKTGAVWNKLSDGVLAVPHNLLFGW